MRDTEKDMIWNMIFTFLTWLGFSLRQVPNLEQEPYGHFTNLNYRLSPDDSSGTEESVYVANTYFFCLFIFIKNSVIKSRMQTSK